MLPRHQRCVRCGALRSTVGHYTTYSRAGRPATTEPGPVRRGATRSVSSTGTDLALALALALVLASLLALTLALSSSDSWFSHVGLFCQTSPWLLSLLVQPCLDPLLLWYFWIIK